MRLICCCCNAPVFVLAGLCKYQIVGNEAGAV